MQNLCACAVSLIVVFEKATDLHNSVRGNKGIKPFPILLQFLTKNVALLLNLKKGILLGLIFVKISFVTMTGIQINVFVYLLLLVLSKRDQNLYSLVL